MERKEREEERKDGEVGRREKEDREEPRRDR